MSKNNYFGCAYDTSEHYWLDGMTEEYIHVWDMEEHKTKIITIGYYGSDFQNLVDNTNNPVKVDIIQEVARDMIRTYKKLAYQEFCKSVIEKKNKVEKGCIVEVIRGRKVKKGTQLEVFWSGEKETFKSKQYSWMHETELIAGCREIGSDPKSKPIWIKAEYLKVLNQPASPKAKEKEKYIKYYLNKHLPIAVLNAARA